MDSNTTNGNNNTDTTFDESGRSELINLSNRTDITDMAESQVISPDMIYEQRVKMEEKMQREDEGGMKQKVIRLEPVKKDSLQPTPPSQEEAAHQASVQDYVNQKLQARAKAMNIDMAGQTASMEKREQQEQEKASVQQEQQHRQASITFPSHIEELEHPPNLPMNNDDSGHFGVSDRTDLFEVSDRSAITPAMIQEQRAKSQAKSSNSRSSSSVPGAVRISNRDASESDDVDDIASPKTPKRASISSSIKRVGSLPSVGENHLQMAPLDASAPLEAKLVNDNEDSEFFKAKLQEEAESYRNQLREEFQEEEKKKKSEQTIVYATATRDDPWSNLKAYLWSRKWKVLVFLEILAGAIVAAVFFALQPEPTPAPTLAPTDLPLVYDPPTAEECAAISNVGGGDENYYLPGQEDMIVELLDVEVDVSLDSEDDDIETLLPSLEAVMKERLVPAFSDCPFEDDSTTRKLLRGGVLRELESNKKNYKYAIANTFLELQSRPGVSCSSVYADQPAGGACHRIVMKLELFLKGPELVSTLMTMIYNVKDRRPVVQTLGLGAPYRVIDFVAINDGTRVNTNTLTPTKEEPLVYDPPTPQDCEDISLGLSLEGQEDMVVELLDVEVDVTLNNETLDIVPLLPSLEGVMKERLVPALSHCPFQGSGNDDQRLLVATNFKYVVANTNLALQDRPGVSCSERSPKPCHRIVMKLELYLKGHEFISTLMTLVYDLRKDRPVVETLGLGSPYTAIDFVAINSASPPSSGTTPPLEPTLAPTEALSLVYDPPTPQDCEDISLGLSLEGQEDMVVELLDVEVDVMLDNNETLVDFVPLMLPSLEGVMKERLVPALSHCPFQDTDRRFLGSENFKYVVANTNLQLQDRPGVSCSERSSQPCHRIVMKLELFLKGHEYVSTLMTLVYDLRKERPVIETLGLGSPYKAIDFVAINSGTPPSPPSTTTASLLP